ncbi:MAG: hypothetical protein RLZZ175_2410 [Bacteroidota bacterium]|jgi:PIN domain nuclease of toxin-antitoxin system
MKYLLDTNVFLYFLDEDFNSLSEAQKAIIDNNDNEIFVSEASYYELSIKARLQKQFTFKFDILELEKYRKSLNIKLLKSKTEFYLGITKVPQVYLSANKLHGDPFDLLIISQAISENLPILSSDRLFPSYSGITVIS